MVQCIGSARTSSTAATAIVTAAIVTAAVALLGAYAYYRKKKKSIPTNWKSIATVKSIFVYPLKSGRRRELANAECSELGIILNEKNVELRDRSFVVYGEGNNEFKTARTFPKLVLIETSVNNNGEIVFTAPGKNDLVVKLPDSKQDAITVTLHSKEPCETVDCGDEAATWISDYLDKHSGLRLGYHRAEYKRNIEKHFSKMLETHRKLSNGSAGLYQDLTSYHLINQSSMDALNSNLTEHVSVNNYRPNIVVEGNDLQAYSEENWDWIKIGDAVFRNVKPCTRCVFTTIDPERATFSKTREPLKTLERTNGLKETSHIKLEGEKGVMGVHLGLYRTGKIAVGDEVYIGY